MDNWIYEIEDVSQLYKKGKIKANDDISFTIQRGEILGVLGPNGAGKSTLIKQLVGHLKPTEGRVLYNGLDVFKQTHVVASQVAYYAQEPHVLSALKVIDALVFTGRLRGMNRKAAEREAEELLDRFVLTDIRDMQLKRLSGGQKRIVGIGTALIGSSPVLILDEPTNELDPKKRRLVWNLILEHNRCGATVILVTHNVLEAEHVVDRAAIVNHGKLLAIDNVAKLKQRVDQRLKFEIQTVFGKRQEAEVELAQWGIVQGSGENRICLMVDKTQASAVLDAIISRRDLPIEEYSVLPPSLEDVYFHIDGHVAKEVIGA
ncbi:ABC transporter ATP-binding protein [Paenibacillus sp. GP183]|uniref:ABC transporter ATP-binding protein n=1 Tax=Paenibacillus sp. GP183 TaxID=1882751 RepID=UPI00089A6E53|nr:ABC transporter ATP-binding protein [Paenibacillus sp. GP183]SEC43155.1 ABC-2 type transport system ATP-binding protein [Paenibacillus sp. GP183]